MRLFNRGVIMDGISYLPTFIKENLFFFNTIMILTISFIFLINISFIVRKLKKKVDLSCLYYHYTTKEGFDAIRNSKGLDGINYGYIYATTNVKFSKLGFSLFTPSKKKYLIIINDVTNALFRKNAHNYNFLSILFPSDLLKIPSEEVISRNKSFFSYDLCYERSSRCLLIKKVNEIHNVSNNSFKRDVNRMIINAPNYAIGIINTSFIISLLFMFSGHDEIINHGIYISLLSVVLSFILILPFLFKVAIYFINRWLKMS